VEARLGEALPLDLWEWAHDGKRLCKLANALKPGLVDMSMLNKRSGPMFHMQNIDFATDGFKKLLPGKYQGRLFRSPDLYEKKSSYPKMIWICLDALKTLDEKGKFTAMPGGAALPPALKKDIEKTKAKYAEKKKEESKRDPSWGGHYQQDQKAPKPLAGGGDTTGEYSDVKAWVEGRLKEKLPDDLWEWSHDGKRLCKLANSLIPGVVDMGMLNKRSGPMFHMQNIDFATDGFKKMLPRKFQGRLFRSPDLYEKKGLFPKCVWICLDALKHLDEDGKIKLQK